MKNNTVGDTIAMLIFYFLLIGLAIPALILAARVAVVLLIIAIGGAVCFALGLAQFFIVASTASKISSHMEKRYLPSKSPAKKSDDNSDPDILFS